MSLLRSTLKSAAGSPPVAVGLLLQPALAAVLAWLLLAEPIGPWQAAGAVVILAGIVLARRGSLGS